MKQKLLIVDDDEEIRTQMKWALGLEYDVFMAGDRPGALGVFREQRPEVILLDRGLPPHAGSSEEGFAALGELLLLDDLAKIIIISGQGEKEKALRAVGEGAYDFLTKPVELEELKVILKRTFHISSLEREYRRLRRHVCRDQGPD